MSKNVLKGNEWCRFLEENQLTKRLQLELYSCTHNYVPIYKLNGYYFSFTITRGYKHLPSLKRLV